MSMPVISATDFTGECMVDETITIDSPMKQFYRDKTVFVTGGTGFLGILFVEKLLRSGVKTLYLLVRPKKNKSPVERMQEIFANVIFGKLKQVDPKYMTRIKLIEGDTYKADLGISDDDRDDIIANVEIVVHAAADVRFDKPLQELCFTNVRATKAMTMLAEQMTKLIVFAYISTAYSQFYRKMIKEKFYPPPCDPEEMIRIAAATLMEEIFPEYFDKHQTEELNFLTDRLIRPWENTYVYTKALSEELVRRVAHKFPTVVVRPSIVISTYEDPIPAWCNNFFGVNGFLTGMGLGFIKVMSGSKDNRTAEVVCADFVTNGTLAAMWNKVNGINNVANNHNNLAVEAENVKKLDESGLIVHITSQDPVSYAHLYEVMLDNFLVTPPAQVLTYPSLTFAGTGLILSLLTIMYHVIPAIVFDAYFRATNNKIRLLPVYRKYEYFMGRTSYFSSGIWNFGHKNLKRIIEGMSEEDQRFFPCNIFKFDSLEFVPNYYLGLRTYVAKEPLDNVAAAKRRFKKIRLVSFLTSILYYGFLGYLLYVFMRVTGAAFYLKEFMLPFN